MNPLREIRMLGQDRPLDELHAEAEGRPRVNYWTGPAPLGGHRYGACVAAWPGMRVEGFADTREDAVEAALTGKRLLEDMAS
jgi:hypothetical protein